jgi:Flp pilus assembly protein TadG
MKAFKPFKRLLKSERGNALAIGAAMMPVLLASAGFALDTIQFALLSRQIQRAADSSALAGAYALAQDNDERTQSATARGAVTRDLTKNDYPTLAQAATVTPGPALGWQRAVAVQLEARPRLPFVSMFTKAGSTVRATATAAIVNNGNFCMLSLYDGTDTGIDLGGNTQLDLGCGIASNARGSAAVTSTGSASVTASPVMAVGGVPAGNYNGARLQPYSAEQRDPYASLPNPPAQTGPCPSIEVKSGETREITAGCYSEIKVKGTLRMGPGDYFINGGDIEFGSGAIVSGSKLTMILTGPNGQAGTFDTDGHPTLNLSASESGVHKGILLYRDRRAAENSITLNGGASAVLTGAIYLPKTNVLVNGNAGFVARCFQLIGLKLNFRGSSNIRNSCDNPNLDPTFQLQFVRLVK